MVFSRIFSDQSSPTVLRFRHIHKGLREQTGCLIALHQLSKKLVCDAVEQLTRQTAASTNSHQF